MTTNVSVTDDYTMSVVSPTPVVTMFTLFQPPPAPASPLGTVEPEEEEDAKAARAAVEAKVITGPGKSPAAKAAAASEAVVTK